MPFYTNAFTPRTEIGASIANIAQAMFANQETPNQAAARQADARKAAAYIDAQAASADYDRARATDVESLTTGRQNYGLPQLRLRFGERAPQIHEFAMGGQGQLPELNPEDMDFVRSLFATADAVNSGGGNADQISKARNNQIEADQDAAMLAGKLSPTQFSQLRGRDVMGMNANGVRFNKVDPNADIQVPDFARKLYDADLQATSALANDRNASASKSRNDMRLGNERLQLDRNKAEREKLVATFSGYDEQGNPMYEYIPQRVGATFKKAPSSKAGKDATGLTMNPKSLADVDGIILGALGADDGFPASTLAAIRGRLSDIAQAGGMSGKFTEDMLYQAIQDVGQELGQDAFGYDPGMFSFERSGSDVLGGAPKPRGKASAPAKAAAQPSAKAPARPNKTDAQLIQEANEAIKAGKDRNAVMQRLQAWGVRVD
jgi:hypothetical protein